MSIGGVNPTQIMQLVRQSLASEQEKIDAKKEEVKFQEDKKLAVGQVDKILEELQNSLATFTKTNLFLQRTVSSSDSDVVVASATSAAPETSFNFGAITQLAQTAKVVSTTSLGLDAGTSPFVLSTADVNGGGNYDPNIAITTNQGGSAITTGSFTLNDVTIEIVTGDTLNTVLTKINNSGANVTAVFDEASDKVRLSGTVVGSDETITFSNGTTNFFTALNLSSVTAGTDNEWEKNLDEGPLSSVTSGYFTINNFTFSVDPATETLEEVISKVNRSNAKVTMFYDSESNRVTIQNKEEGTALLLANDTSGFLSAIGVMNQGTDQDADAAYSKYLWQDATFTLNGQAMTRDKNTFTINGVTFSLLGTTATGVTVSVTKNADKTVDTAKEFAAQFNATLSLLNKEIKEKEGPLEGNSQLRDLRQRLLSDVLKTIQNPGQYTSLADIGFEIKNSGNGDFTLSLNEDKFRTQLQDNESDVQQLFAYDSDGNGLLTDGGYAIATRTYLDTFTRSVSGSFFKLNDRLIDLIDSMNITVDAMEARLTKKEEKKFREFVDQIVNFQKLQEQAARIQQSSAILLQQTLGA